MRNIQSIQNRIYELRGQRVMLDYDLSALCEFPTKALNQAVKRNIKRFPEDFMFRLSVSEWQIMRSQTVTTSENINSLGSQNVTMTPRKIYGMKKHQKENGKTDEGLDLSEACIISNKNQLKTTI